MGRSTRREKPQGCVISHAVAKKDRFYVLDSVIGAEWEDYDIYYDVKADRVMETRSWLVCRSCNRDRTHRLQVCREKKIL